MVVDISDGGLRVRRYSGNHLPSQLAIYDQSDRVFRPVVVAWRRGDEIGLRFTDSMIPATPPEIERLSGRSDWNDVYILKGLPL
ncbi:hypothetical protein VSX64_12920 [Aurantimonas sp. C2-6-R+9]|nr:MULTISPECIES: hypothetical protein [unclassified Aurantimonas]MEC5291633.1 hypothetical protein [Aurantimonas sp. C2-3-R2]MEC5322058.1 hypothetical protein [Aurantimonas sp. A3-2-R12]MEC5381772.1 hypothetical protein [Aurantimonas sp. C2-6-R+9]MEC5412717.1 hypothetical protein [Aurantimonas sp. C2-4-R8]